MENPKVAQKNLASWMGVLPKMLREELKIEISTQLFKYEIIYPIINYYKSALL